MMMNEKELTNDYIEGLLRDHFKAEVAELPASIHPWDWLKTPVGVTAPTSRKL